MNRRKFIDNLTRSAGTLIALPLVVTACEDPMENTDDPNNRGDNVLIIDLLASQNSALTSSGGSLIRNDIIIINTGGGFVALSSICTHTGCTVTYNSASGELPCPCHGSLFSINGSVLQGPAEAPLKRYSIEQQGDILRIDLS